jgi:hypothetical protein
MTNCHGTFRWQNGGRVLRCDRCGMGLAGAEQGDVHNGPPAVREGEKLVEIYKKALLEIVEFSHNNELPGLDIMRSMARVAREAISPTTFEAGDPRMNNAWASKEAAPPGAVELKHEPPTVFDHELQTHRARIDNFWKHPPSSMTYATKEDVLSDAVRFLLAVAHAPGEPKLEERVVKENADCVDAHGNIRLRVGGLEGRIAKLEKEQATFLFPFRDAVRPSGLRPEQAAAVLHYECLTHGLHLSACCEAARRREPFRPEGTIFEDASCGALLPEYADTFKERLTCTKPIGHEARHWAKGKNSEISWPQEESRRRNARPVRHIIERDDPTIVCLCGSTKFAKAFADANLEETLKGNIVLTVGSMTHSDDELGKRITPEVKTMLDNLHKKKIEMADEVLVLNAMRCEVCGGVQRKDFDNWGHHNWCQYFKDSGSYIDRAQGWAPYIGESTKGEIEHALRLRKHIRFLNPQGRTGCSELFANDTSGAEVEDTMHMLGLREAK